MAGKSKDRVPPYEVMGRRGGASPVEGEGETVSDTVFSSDAMADAAPAATTTQTPVATPVPASSVYLKNRGPALLRVPPGYAVVFGLGALLLLVLAYWVGYHEGVKAEQKRVQRKINADLEVEARASSLSRAMIDHGDSRPLPAPNLDRSPSPAQPVAPANPAPETALPGDSLEADARQPGLNYFVLVHYPQEEAKLLVSFLAEGGIEAAAIPVGPRRCKVVALKGVPSEQIGGAARNQYEQRLKQLGRKWQSERRGAGDLSDMYLELYTHKAP
ncbi:MAG: hypothetical protein IT440_06655 [Phycisphaeraceae bacterium]|nr:hypothetical protein [Phycisphaeraceae bacterium]